MLSEATETYTQSTGLAAMTTKHPHMLTQNVTVADWTNLTHMLWKIDHEMNISNTGQWPK
jgi:hypothetical protein